jgi:hypothetical protein
MILNFFEKFLKKYSNIKFYKNPSNEREVLPSRWKEEQRDVMKLIVVFRNFANVPNKKEGMGNS